MSSLILIADDAAEGVEILDAALRRDGFRTVVAADGQQAADLHASLKPDLALLSVRLSVRDGWDVLGELRRRGETPVIMVGDRDEAADKLQALRIGADDYIAKPFKPAEVTASIQTILRRSGGGRAAKTLRVICPSHQHKGDVTDWIQREGGTREKLCALIEKATFISKEEALWSDEALALCRAKKANKIELALAMGKTITLSCETADECDAWHKALVKAQQSAENGAGSSSGGGGSGNGAAHGDKKMSVKEAASK